jgi:hypothetical protein
VNTATYYKSQLKISDADAWIERAIAEARNDKLAREFAHNAVTAATKLPSPAPVEIFSLQVGNTPKLAFWNESEPIDRKNADRLFGELSSSGQFIHVSGKYNFGVGARLTGLKFNPHGLVYWVCANGDAFEIKLARINENGKLVYRPSRPRDLSDAELKAHGRTRLGNWVMAILMGETAQHNTVTHPFGRRTKSKPGWLQTDLLRRYYTLPSKVKVQITGSVLNISGAGTATFASLSAFVSQFQDMAAAPKGFTPGVTTGARQTIGPVALPELGKNVTAGIEYLWTGGVDAPLGTGLTMSGKGLPVIEVYDAKSGDKWARKALSFGVFNGAYKQAMALVHLSDPDDDLAIETHREFIRLNSGKHLNSDEFAEHVAKHMPAWFSDLVQVNTSSPSSNRSAAFFDKLVQKHKLTADVWRKAKQGQPVAPGNVIQFNARTGPRTGVIITPTPTGATKKPALQPLNNAPQAAQPVTRPLMPAQPQWPDAATVATYGYTHTVGVFIRSINGLLMNEHHPQYIEFMERVAQRCAPVPRAFVALEYRVVAEEAAIAAIISALLLASKNLATMEQVDDMTGPPAVDPATSVKRHDGMALTAAVLAALDANEDQIVRRVSTAARINPQQVVPSFAGGTP